MKPLQLSNSDIAFSGFVIGFLIVLTWDFRLYPLLSKHFGAEFLFSWRVWCRWRRGCCWSCLRDWEVCFSWIFILGGMTGVCVGGWWRRRNVPRYPGASCSTVAAPNVNEFFLDNFLSHYHIYLSVSVLNRKYFLLKLCLLMV